MRKYRLYPLPDRFPPELERQLAAIETATIGHFHQRGFMAPAIRPLRPGSRVAGCAVTLSIPGPDSTLLHHVLGLVRPGDVLVIERPGGAAHACWGGGVTRAARQAGLAGAIIDGPCTDPAEIGVLGFPLWCAGISPLTTRMMNTSGRFNVPISCGGVAVCPGDLVIADDSGVVVIARDEIDDVVADARALMRVIEMGEKRLDDGELLGRVYGASALVEDD